METTVKGSSGKKGMTLHLSSEGEKDITEKNIKKLTADEDIFLLYSLLRGIQLTAISLDSNFQMFGFSSYSAELYIKERDWKVKLNGQYFSDNAEVLTRLAQAMYLKTEESINEMDLILDSHASVLETLERILLANFDFKDNGEIIRKK